MTSNKEEKEKRRKRQKLIDAAAVSFLIPCLMAVWAIWFLVSGVTLVLVHT